MYAITTSLKRIAGMKKRVKVAQGSSSSGKTISILIILIEKAIRTQLEISVVSESVPHLKKGALKDFLKIMKVTGRFQAERYHKTERKYTFSNGSYIEFFSPESILGARRDILYINEANNISFEDYYQLSIRTNNEIYLDYNPSVEFWVQTEVMNDPDVDFIILTYKDNEKCPPSIVIDLEKALFKGFYNIKLSVKELFEEINIKSKYWANRWRVYGLGLQGVVEGVIFGDFTIVQTFPKGCKWIVYGLDFGFTNDPTTLIKIGLYNGELYFEELIFETGLTNSMLSERLKALKIGGAEIVADSADPKSIRELQIAGYNVRGAVKGPDSIVSGIDTMRQYAHNIVATSLNMITEWRGYSYKFDKAINKFTNEPQDHLNHTADAARYGVSYKIPRQNLPPAIVWR